MQLKSILYSTSGLKEILSFFLSYMRNQGQGSDWWARHETFSCEKEVDKNVDNFKKAIHPTLSANLIYGLVCKRLYPLNTKYVYLFPFIVFVYQKDRLSNFLKKDQLRVEDIHPSYNDGCLGSIQMKRIRLFAWSCQLTLYLDTIYLMEPLLALTLTLSCRCIIQT